MLAVWKLMRAEIVARGFFFVVCATADEKSVVHPNFGMVEFPERFRRLWVCDFRGSTHPDRYQWHRRKLRQPF